MILGLVYSIYAMVVSLDIDSASNAEYAIRLSYAPTIQAAKNDSSVMDSILIQSCLLLVVMLIWMLSNMVINWFRLRNKQLVDENTITAGDFSIMIENIPYQITE